jgi:DNA-binding MarR family transcriptional regulator
MSTTNFQDDLNWLLIKASMVAKQRLLKVAEDHDLSLMQALTLCLLEPGDTVPMSSISDWLTCDPSNVTGIVERLSNDLFIERREKSTDRRVKTIQLTPSGIAIREKLLPKIDQDSAINLAQLTEEERKTLRTLILKTLPEQTIRK